MRMRAATPLFVALLALGGCSALSKLTRFLPGHAKVVSPQDLKVAAPPGANLNSATALDLVFVYDGTAAGMLPKTGPEWFAQKTALESGLGRSVDVVSLQIPPATVVDKVKLPKRHDKALAVYGFANYLAKGGQGRSDLSGFHHAVIWLEPAQINISER